MRCFSSNEGRESLQSDEHFLANRNNEGRRKYKAIVGEERWLQLNSVGMRHAQNAVNPVYCVSRGLICQSNESYILYASMEICKVKLTDKGFVHETKTY